MKASIQFAKYTNLKILKKSSQKDLVIEIEPLSELSKVEESSPESYSLSQGDCIMSDVEISESESEIVDDESEDVSVRKKRGGKLGKVNEKGETPLHQACVEGKVDKVSRQHDNFCSVLSPCPSYYRILCSL